MTYWTEDRKAAAADFWRDGLSATAIAARLGGVSRNAVLGLMNRHRDVFPFRTDCSGRVNVRQPAKPKPIREPKVKVEKPAKVRVEKPSARMSGLIGSAAKATTDPQPRPRYRHRAAEGLQTVAFGELTSRQCAWPMTDFDDADGYDMPSCGKAIQADGSVLNRYCAHHRLVSVGRVA